MCVDVWVGGCVCVSVCVHGWVLRQYISLSLFSPRRRDHLCLHFHHFPVNDLHFCLTSVGHKMIQALFFILVFFSPSFFALLISHTCILFFLICMSFLLLFIFVLMCLSLQCSPLLKARRLIQKTGSAWRCVLSISACFYRTKQTVSIRCLFSFSFSRLVIFLLIFLCTPPDSQAGRGSLHSHLRSPLQVSASGEERLGTTVSQSSLCIVFVHFSSFMCVN